MHLLETMIYPMLRDLPVLHGTQSNPLVHNDSLSGETRTIDHLPLNGAYILTNEPSKLYYVTTYLNGHLHCYNGFPSSAVLGLTYKKNTGSWVPPAGMPNIQARTKNYQEYYWVNKFGFGEIDPDSNFKYKHPYRKVFENFELETCWYNFKEGIYSHNLKSNDYLEWCKNNNIDLNNLSEEDINLINMRFC